MRKRHIKSIAHWTIMSLLLLFPVLMVGISAFANDEQSVTVTEEYEYQTNDVNSPSDLVNGNIYLLNLYGLDRQDVDDVFATFSIVTDFIYYKSGTIELTLKPNCFIEFNYSGANLDDTNSVGFGDYDYVDYSNVDFSGLDYIYFIYYSNSFNYSINIGNAFPLFITDSDYLGEKTTTVDIQNASYKQEVNNWANGFKNLPVNQWYGSLLDTMGIGDTTNSVMNVIYVYPLYVLWVYILDLIVDCLLLIINFGHDALHRLGADNE